MITQRQYHVDWVFYVIIPMCERNIIIIVCMQQNTLHPNYVLLGPMMNSQLINAFTHISK